MKGKANISFDPYANLLFGTLFEVQTSEKTPLLHQLPDGSGGDIQTRNYRQYTYVRKIGALGADSEFRYHSIP
jgi:hypothetical protein